MRCYDYFVVSRSNAIMQKASGSITVPVELRLNNRNDEETNKRVLAIANDTCKYTRMSHCIYAEV